MTMLKKSIKLNVLPRLIAALLFVAVLAGTWDVWWHTAVGRDTFWEPPHLFLYSSVIIVIALGFFGWWKTREPVWKRLALVLILIPLSAPFDDMWHRFFGVENIGSPLVIWSPPHLVLIGALVGSMAMILPLLSREEPPVFTLFGAMMYGAMASLLTLITTPLEPLGPWHLMEFWGTGFGSFVLVLVLLFASKRINSPGGAFLTTLFFILFAAVSYHGQMPTDITVASHDHAPLWLPIFAFLAGAVLIDSTKKLPILLRGALAGLVWSAVLYGFATRFFEPQFQYGIGAIAIAIIVAVLGGIVAAFVFRLINRVHN